MRDYTLRRYTWRVEETTQVPGERMQGAEESKQQGGRVQGSPIVTHLQLGGSPPASSCGREKWARAKRSAAPAKKAGQHTTRHRQLTCRRAQELKGASKPGRGGSYQRRNGSTGVGANEQGQHQRLRGEEGKALASLARAG